MPFSTALFITPIASNFPAKACANTRSCQSQTQLPLERKRVRRQISKETQRRSNPSGFASESRPVFYRNRCPVSSRNHCPESLEYADLSKSDALLVAAIESNVPDLTIARTLIDDFQQMIRSKAVAKLDAWLEGAKASLVGSFANGVQKDIAAVRNAIISPWSNGQTEGQITKLKLIKRQMYGRAKIDLLQARLIGAT
ncbi:transposase [Mesorhizobium sp. M0074]|uniref:transposase n=1 Tax=Mesorhizobium sp. M0074 TaxID=2956869 RepID=UPI0033372CE3